MTPHEIHDIVSSGRWETDARRARVLERWQVLVILACGVAALITSILFSRQIVEQTDDYIADQELVVTLTDLHSRMLAEHKVFWQREARGEPGLGLGTRLFAAQGPVLLRGLIARDKSVTPEKARIHADLRVAVDDFAARIRAQPNFDPASPEGRAFVTAADRSVERIATLVQRWVDIERGGMIARTLEGRSSAEQAAVVVAGIVVFLTALVVVSSVFLNR